MKIIFLTNNEISRNLINWLKDEAKEEVIVIRENITKEMVEREKADFLISYNYRYIIKEGVLDLLEDRAINLHISLLPWNRGADPNVWSFLEDTPKGVTIHLIDAGIDTGDILLQREVKICEEEESLSSSYAILHKTIQELFISNWDDIKHCKVVPKAQLQKGSMHYTKDFPKIKSILGNEGWDIQIPELKSRFRQLLNNERKLI